MAFFEGHFQKSNGRELKKGNEPGGIRTPGLLVRSPPVFQAENRNGLILLSYRAPPCPTEYRSQGHDMVTVCFPRSRRHRHNREIIYHQLEGGGFEQSRIPA